MTPMQDIADKLRRAARRGEQLRLPADLVQALYATPTLMQELARLEALEHRRQCPPLRLVKPASASSGYGSGRRDGQATPASGASAGLKGEPSGDVAQALQTVAALTRHARRSKR